MVLKRAFRSWIWLGLALLLVFNGWQLSAGAADSLLTSRVNQLEANLSILRSQVTQLQAQISRAGNGASPTPPPRETTLFPGDPSLETQFDNLAILTIELRDRILALESSVTALENRSSE